MKIRIFALAKELDIDSKVLIDHCAKAGITIKNSALASISPEERDRVMDVIRSSKSSAPSSSSAPPTMAPVTREQAVDVANKSRPMRNMSTPVAKPSRSQPAEKEPAAPEEVAVPILQDLDVEKPSVQTEPTPTRDELPLVPKTVAQSTTPENIDAPTVTTATTAELPSQPPEIDTPTEVSADEPPSSNPDAPRIKPVAPPSSPLVPRAIRSMSMTARSSSDFGSGKSTGAKRPKAAGPALAAIPDFKHPTSKVPKPEEAAPQKPVIRLNPDGQQKTASPLRNRIPKGGADAKKKTAADQEDQTPAKAKHGDVGRNIEESRLLRRSKKVTRTEEEEEEARPRKGPIRPKHRHHVRTELKSTAEIEFPITVRSLSEAIGRPANSIIQILFTRGNMVTINSALDETLAVETCLELGVDLKIHREKDIEDQVAEAAIYEDSPDALVTRPPIITILGHVDHGKTTLVDKLRSSNVAASEHGGITQHIAAYQIQHNGHALTFVDTPGHAAFGEMRARGANVTDIVVLVVAGNDGVMPQTVECISHAKAAGVPMIVAMNKCDLPDRNEQRVLTDLSAHDVLAAEWGGDVEVVRTSGLTGQGLPDLLDTILLTADLHEFKANPNRPASGNCLEAFRDEGRGPLAWLIVRTGTLRVGDSILCGEAFGRIRAMYNERDEEVQEAGPSAPIKVAGLDVVPSAGDAFVVLADIDAAREAAEQRRQKGRAAQLANMGGRRTLEDILNAARDGAVQDLNVILKADTPGSLEALRSELNKFEHPEVRIKLLHDGVGGVNESDISLAAASNAIIFAFHVIADDRAQLLAQRDGVEIRRYNIIYEVMDEIKRILEGMLRPEKKEIITGRAIVLRTFNISRFGTIAGCRVLNGTIERSHRINLIRDQKVLNTYNIASLKREKDDAKEVREGMECGIRLENFNDVKEGDLLEAFKIEEVKRTLES
ncbi:MAG: translation initiation factor IF-2 [Planctomycetes bacterium]|nr:translation initiation factor IF-2 [Planctomycetota bacterium]